MLLLSFHDATRVQLHLTSHEMNLSNVELAHMTLKAEARHFGDPGLGTHQWEQASPPDVNSYIIPCTCQSSCHPRCQLSPTQWRMRGLAFTDPFGNLSRFISVWTRECVSTRSCKCDRDHRSHTAHPWRASAAQASAS